MLTVPESGLRFRIPLWLTILVISRDLAIVLTVAVVNLAIGRKTFVPSLLGKTATAVYIVTCVAVLTANYAGGGEAMVSTAVILSAVITVVLGAALRRARDARHQLLSASPATGF